MKLLCVHPSGLFFSDVFLRLEPIGLELAAAAALAAGHDVRMVDLQAEKPRALFRMLRSFEPDAVAFSCNYLPNLPEVVDLAKAIRAERPGTFIFVGGHSASFTAEEFLEHGAGAIDCVLRGEGEIGVPQLLEAVKHDRDSIAQVPGVVTLEGHGPPPQTVENLDDLMPARHLLRRRRKYFIGVLDPAASIEFSRGCPWDCSFCSAWTFYGRRYRLVSPERVVEDLERIREPGVFVVDDVAFIQEEHGLAIAEEVARRGIEKRYYMETRGDVLIRNQHVFKRWAEIGLRYMFLGLEAIDEEGLKKFRKRVSTDKNQEALAIARSLGIEVIVNIIADPDWDEARFQTVYEWVRESPEIVNVSVNTPYPGTETWLTESRKLVTRDYRLFDIQHAVLPTRLPRERFYAEMVRIQTALRERHLGWKAFFGALKLALKLLMKGQTNFVRMLAGFSRVYNPKHQLRNHARPVKYEIRLPPERATEVDRQKLYVLQPPPRQ
ncbi:MAG: hopanoid C-3 methylase HpnR, partial [Gemmatimonadetes bacterium]